MWSFLRSVQRKNALAANSRLRGREIQQRNLVARIELVYRDVERIVLMRGQNFLVSDSS